MICSPLWWCRGHVQYPAFAPKTLFLLQALHKWQLGILISFVQNLPQLCIPIVIFSPIQFLCILFLEKRCVQVQALQQESPRSQLVSMPSERRPYSSAKMWRQPKCPSMMNGQRCSLYTQQYFSVLKGRKSSHRQRHG